MASRAPTPTAEGPLLLERVPFDAPAFRPAPPAAGGRAFGGVCGFRCATLDVLGAAFGCLGAVFGCLGAAFGLPGPLLMRAFNLLRKFQALRSVWAFGPSPARRSNRRRE